MQYPKTSQISQQVVSLFLDLLIPPHTRPYRSIHVRDSVLRLKAF